VIVDRVADQVQLHVYRATDTSISLTIMLDHIIYELSWALARVGASVDDSPKSPSNWVPITSFSVLECYLIWLYFQLFLI